MRDFPEDASLIKLAVEFEWKNNNPGKAMMLLEQGLKHAPADPDLNNKMAQIAYAIGEHDKAIKYWKKALEISDEMKYLQEDIAEALMFLGKYQEAVETLEEKNKDSSPSARSYYLLGQGYLQLENYEKAKEYLEKAVVGDSSQSVMCYYLLSKVHMRLKQPDKAQEYVKLHRELKAKTTVRRHEWEAKGDIYVVDISTRVRLEVFPKVMAQLCMFGNDLYVSRQNNRKAKELLEKTEKAFEHAIKLAPDKSDIYREFAYMYLTTGRNIFKARELAEKAVTLDGSAANYFILSSAYHKISEPAKALSAMERAIELDTDNLIYKQVYNTMRNRRR